MSEKSSHKTERRRSSSSSSSYSSTCSDSSGEVRVTIKERPKPINPVSKVSLDIGYKIQQEELSDSDESASSTPPRARSQSNDILKYSSLKDKKRDRSKTPDRKQYRSPGNHNKRNERSPSKDSRKDRSQSKDIKLDLDSKNTSKYDHSSSYDGRKRSKSKERKRERSRSRDRRKRRSKSRERKLTRSPSKDKKKERSRSRERKRERSKSKDRIKDKKRERSRSREKRREKLRRESRSPSYYKESKPYSHFKRDRSRERSNKRSRSRSRSRSRPRKRSRSRSRSFDRSKRLYDKKFNKLSILEKLGIELKVPEGQVPGEGSGNTPGFTIPSYYNPGGVNPLKYAQQMQKRKLIWGSKKQESEPSAEKKEEEKEAKPETAVGPESVWKGTTFSQDQDGKLTAKFKRLMGIKDSGGEAGGSQKSSELIQKQEEMFSSMEKQYEVARVSTHTHRGLGLGFGVHMPR